MVAAVLHLHEGAGARKTLEHVRGGLAHGRDVADEDFFCGADAEVLARQPPLAKSAARTRLQ